MVEAMFLVAAAVLAALAAIGLLYWLGSVALAAWDRRHDDQGAGRGRIS
jgi:hypothetical protein